MTYDEVERFNPLHLKTLTDCGILNRSFPTDVVICNECEQHCTQDAEVVYGPDGKVTGACIYCDGRDDLSHRIPISLERLQCWHISSSGLADVLKVNMRLSSTPQEIVVGRFWRLGVLRSAVGRIDVFMAVGVAARDFPHVWTKALSALEECTCATLLTPAEYANRRNLPPNIHTFSLTRLLTIEDGKLYFDLDELLAASGASSKCSVESRDDFRFSEDFASAGLGDKTYKLTRQQSLVIKALYEARLNRTPWLHKDHLLIEVLESNLDRLRDVFKSNMEVWKDLIVGDNKGNYRLNID